MSDNSINNEPGREITNRTGDHDTSHLSNMGNWALWYRERGLRPIPLGGYLETPPDWLIARCGGNVEKAFIRWSKTARINWTEFQSRHPTRAEIIEWWTCTPNANIGLITGIEIVVVSARTARTVRWCKKNLPYTPWVCSSDGGKEFFYKASNSTPNTYEGKGLTVKSLGDFAIVPPSQVVKLEQLSARRLSASAGVTNKNRKHSPGNGTSHS